MKEVYKALFEAQKDLHNIKTDSTNPHYGNNYASLVACLDSVKDPLAKHGLMLSQYTAVLGQEILLNTCLVHLESGEVILSQYPIRPAKLDPQGYGSALSYAKRYSILTILVLDDTDDDANYATNASNTINKSNNAAERQSLAKTGPTEPQIKRLFAIAHKTNWTKRDISNYLAKLGIKEVDELNYPQYDSLCKNMERFAKEAFEDGTRIEQ